MSPDPSPDPDRNPKIRSALVPIASPLAIAPAEMMETSCSPDRPPKSSPTFNFAIGVVTMKDPRQAIVQNLAKSIADEGRDYWCGGAIGSPGTNERFLGKLYLLL
jgi:hypothetical protein